MRPVYLISKTPHDGVIHIPILKTAFLSPDIDFTLYQGIIVTSKQSFIALEHYTFSWENLQCICVSEGTANAAKNIGISHPYVGDGYGKSIPELIEREGLFGRWLYVRPKVIASDWIKNVSSKITIDEKIVYETTCNEESEGIDIDREGVLIFTSPSSIECYLRWYPILPTHSVVVIGKTTQNALPNGISAYLSPDTSVASAVDLAQRIAAEN